MREVNPAKLMLHYGHKKLTLHISNERKDKVKEVVKKTEDGQKGKEVF